MIRGIRLVLLVTGACAAAGTTSAQSPPRAGGGSTLSFNGGEYAHRWSKAGQHEFTPPGQEDLTKWTSMITINVHDSVKTGDQLADLANRVLAKYQGAGHIVKTDSKPRTESAEAEHLAVAVLGDPNFIEAAFARVLLRDGHGLIIVHSRRVYGQKAGDVMSAWLEKNGPGIEKELMEWGGIPSPKSLAALPESTTDK